MRYSDRLNKYVINILYIPSCHKKLVIIILKSVFYYLCLPAFACWNITNSFICEKSAARSSVCISRDRTHRALCVQHDFHKNNRTKEGARVAWAWSVFSARGRHINFLQFYDIQGLFENDGNTRLCSHLGIQIDRFHNRPYMTPLNL